MDSMLCAAIRGEGVEEDLGGQDPDSLLERAALHGVIGLLSFLASAGRVRLPEPLATRAASHARATAALEAIRGRETRSILRVLADDGIESLILKGAALAHTIYPQPWIRERIDTDILVRPGDAKRTMELLRSLGYAAYAGLPASSVVTQASFHRRAPPGYDNVVDLHWAIKNSGVLSDTIQVDDCFSRARTLSGLGDGALTIDPILTLLLACVHRASHLVERTGPADGDFPTGNRLIWLYDIHLLLAGFNRDEWQEFCRQAGMRRIAEICRDAVEIARRRFGAGARQFPVEELGGRGWEPSRVFLSGQPGAVGIAELAHRRGIASKWRFLRDNLFPPAMYIREKYHASSRWTLPFLYGRRILAGAFHRLLARR
jgi:hypothetical protein